MSAMLLGCYPGAPSGRSGNSKYDKSLFEEATQSYQQGIDKILANVEEDPSGPVLTGLLNNAGASLLRSEQHAEARDNFVASVTTASAPDEKGRGYYNAGNAAYAEEEKNLSTDYFRKALLQEPDNIDAKYNYELVMRELAEENENNQDQSGGDPPPPPSAYAKELKKQAEELVAQRRYQEAQKLMNDGLAVDPSVQAFQDFIDRISSVIGITDS